ncbi:MAG: EAL domain-containing protein [Myxococcota bacterium]
MRILLIEDNPADAHLFEKYLEEESDLEVSVESSLGDGIERCAHETFDLVMLDLSLPDSSGLETLTRFCSEVESGPAVMLLTGLNDRAMALRAVQAGAQDFVVKGAVSPTALVAAIRHSVERHRMSQELMAANDRVRYLATHCSLTDLPNRYLLMDRMENAIASSARSGVGLAVLFVDLDHFKLVNDTYGHEAGDLVLRKVGERLKAATRSSDTVARLGGDEFAILLRGATDPSSIEKVAAKISRELSRSVEIGDAEVTALPSIGIALYPTDGTTSESLLRNADAAMYHSKKNQETHRFWSEDLRTGSQNRIGLERDLLAAIEGDELLFRFQPQVDGRTGRILGVEALTRWQRPDFGWMSPVALFPLAEELGLTEDLGRWVMQAATKVQSAWRSAGISNVRLSINFSEPEIQSASFLLGVHEALQSCSLSGSDFTFDVPESCFVKGLGATIGALRILQEEGVRIALDDFGSGLCALGFLAEAPVDEIKVDPRIVQGAAADPALRKTLRAMIHLAQDLELDLVAEGVETHAQLDLLLANGCERMQGHLFVEALDLDEATELLKRGTVDLPTRSE